MVLVGGEKREEALLQWMPWGKCEGAPSTRLGQKIPSMPRDISASLAVLRALQGKGMQWMSGVKLREEVVAQKVSHLQTLGLSFQDLPPIIHVAGTKGKGSTCAMVESCLLSAGLRTGLFTSPHLVCPTERFRVDGRVVDQEAYLETFWETYDALVRREVEESRGGAQGEIPLPSKLPGFNFLALLALRLFLKARVDVVILEVGIGGLLCTTNTFPENKVLASGITMLDFDHCALLGGTLAAIASQKAGVLRKGVPAVAAPARPEAQAVLESTSVNAGAPLVWADEGALARAAPGGVFPPLALKGRFQSGNAAMAVALTHLALRRAVSGEVIWPLWNSTALKVARVALNSLEGECGRVGGATSVFGAVEAGGGGGSSPTPLPPVPLPPWILAGLASADWQGRAQILPLPGGKGQIFLDGAHTEMSMAEVALWHLDHGRKAKGTSAREKNTLVFFAGRDKDVLSLLLPLSVSATWDAVHIVSVPASLSPGGEPKDEGALWRGVLETFCERKGVVASAFKCYHESGFLEGKGLKIQGDVDEDPLQQASRLWLSVLQRAWDTVNTDSEFSGYRKEWREWLKQEGSCERGAVESGSINSDTTTFSSPLLFASVKDSLHTILEESQDSSASVLVTGSLYLVGATLEECSHLT